MRKFYTHTRHDGIIYAELVDQSTGAKLSARSTGTKNRDEAMLVIAKWFETGIPVGRKEKPRSLAVATGLKAILKSIKKTDLTSDDAMQIVAALKERELIDMPVIKRGKGGINFGDFLANFWDYSASPYVREKLAHGHTIGKRHCYDMANRVHNYWLPFFNDRTLGSVTKADLKKFSLELSDKGLAPGSINKILLVGTSALAWAYREEMIPVDPAEGLTKFSGKRKKRGVLTPQEAAQIFALEWKDKRAYVGNLLALTTGMRSGEVLALRKSDISGSENIIYLRHSWSPDDGLKSPKNGDERKVPLLPEVRKMLLELLAQNYHDTPDPFIFWGSLADKPIVANVLLDGLKDACRAVGIDPKARAICVHSARHYYAARMADRMTAEQVRRITGHKTLAVFEEYADHVTNENLAVAESIGAEVFGNILKFRKIA
jgi:integrase